MHVETLKTFCDLVETGSLSRAARMNLISQSAVSQQLRALERRYGRRLIERAPRIGARATEAGRLLYDEVKPLVERLATLEQRLRARPDVVAGTVRVPARPYSSMSASSAARATAMSEGCVATQCAECPSTA